MNKEFEAFKYKLDVNGQRRDGTTQPRYDVAIEKLIEKHDEAIDTLRLRVDHWDELRWIQFIESKNVSKEVELFAKAKKGLDRRK